MKVRQGEFTACFLAVAEKEDAITENERKTQRPFLANGVMIEIEALSLLSLIKGCHAKATAAFHAILYYLYYMQLFTI